MLLLIIKGTQVVFTGRHSCMLLAGMTIIQMTGASSYNDKLRKNGLKLNGMVK
jgi:hypothetical protein